MSRIGKTALGCVLLAAAAGLPAQAQSSRDAEAPVRVYTNADLEKLPPLPPSSEPVLRDDDLGWEFVTEFIEREHRRLDADRAYELEGRRDATKERIADEREGDYVLPWVPWGFNPRVRHDGHRPGDFRRVDAGVRLGGSIAPLHARPSQAMVQRARAIRRSGADAFPSRSR